MGRHAILSASASKRWMNCTPSALLEKQFADEESIYAAEGTAAHALAEHKLKRFLKKRSKRPVSDYDCDETVSYTNKRWQEQEPSMPCTRKMGTVQDVLHP